MEKRMEKKDIIEAVTAIKKILDGKRICEVKTILRYVQSHIENYTSYSFDENAPCPVSITSEEYIEKYW